MISDLFPRIPGLLIKPETNSPSRARATAPLHLQTTTHVHNYITQRPTVLTHSVFDACRSPPCPNANLYPLFHCLLNPLYCLSLPIGPACDACSMHHLHFIFTSSWMLVMVSFDASLKVALKGLRAARFFAVSLLPARSMSLTMTAVLPDIWSRMAPEPAW